MEYWQFMWGIYKGMNLSNKGVQNETFICDSPSAQESNVRHVRFQLIQGVSKTIVATPHTLGTLGVC